MELDLMVLFTRAPLYQCVSVPLYIIVPVQVKGRQERSGTVKHLEVRYKSTNRLNTPNQTLTSHSLHHAMVNRSSYGYFFLRYLILKEVDDITIPMLGFAQGIRNTPWGLPNLEVPEIQFCDIGIFETFQVKAFRRFDRKRILNFDLKI